MLSSLSPFKIIVLALVLCVVLIGSVALVFLAFAPAGAFEKALPYFTVIPPMVVAILSLLKLDSIEKGSKRRHSIAVHKLDRVEKKQDATIEKVDTVVKEQEQEKDVNSS